MSAIQVQGLLPLNGSITVQGSKNAVLPMMAAALLSRGTTVLTHVPAIADVFSMMEILKGLGCKASFSDGVLEIDGKEVSEVSVPRAFVGKMRSSFLVLGPLLSRMGEAVTWHPGGCVIGKRPIDFHVEALKQLGAEFFDDGGMILARTEGLLGTRIRLPYPSVGATENVLTAAVLARGTTVLSGAAREPEIEELCRFLRAMGAKISGDGTGTLVIEGVKELFPCEFFVGGDRICAGTYGAAAVMTGGDVAIRGVNPRWLREPLRLFKEMGAEVSEGEEIRVSMKGRPKALHAVTGPYPAFPTDLQPVFLSALSLSEGRSSFRETVFEARFAAALSLRQFGARVFVDGDRVFVEGRYPLKPAIVTAPDLRGGAALVLAALGADGLSLIHDRGHLSRGYEDFCRDLRSLGADVELLM